MSNVNLSTLGMVQLLAVVIITAARTFSTKLFSAYCSQRLPCLSSSTTKSVIIRQNSIRLMSSSVTNDASSKDDDLKRLVLVGGGHAHVQGM